MTAGWYHLLTLVGVDRDYLNLASLYGHMLPLESKYQLLLAIVEGKDRDVIRLHVVVMR